MFYYYCGVKYDAPSCWAVITYLISSHCFQAFEGWGYVLRKQYGRHDKYVKSDFAVNYLGYWTDNGLLFPFIRIYI